MTGKKLIGFTTLLRLSAQQYSAQIVPLLIISLVFVIPAVFIIYFALSFNPFGEPAFSQITMIIFQLVYLFTAVLISIASILSANALLIYTMKVIRREKVSILTAYRESLRCFPSLLKFNIYYSTRILLWTLLFVLPGIYFGALYAFAPLVFLSERTTAKEAMAASRALIKPHFVKYLDYFLFVILLAVISCIPFFVVFDYLMDMSLARQLWKLATVFDFFEMMIVLMALQFMLVFYAQFYESLRQQDAPVQT